MNSPDTSQQGKRHDSLCPKSISLHRGQHCECDLIRRAEARGYERGYEDGRNALTETIKKDDASE